MWWVVLAVTHSYRTHFFKIFHLKCDKVSGQFHTTIVRTFFWTQSVQLIVMCHSGQISRKKLKITIRTKKRIWIKSPKMSKLFFCFRDAIVQDFFCFKSDKKNETKPLFFWGGEGVITFLLFKIGFGFRFCSFFSFIFRWKRDFSPFFCFCEKCFL